MTTSTTMTTTTTTLTTETTLTVLAWIVETRVVRASSAGVARRAEALEVSPVVVVVVVVAADDAILLSDTGGAIFARTILATLSSQFAEDSVIANRTNAFVRTRGGRLL